MDWYYKAALVIALIWGAARALGAYGEAARELDINFLYGFLLTLGGWGIALLIVDRVARALGWRKQTRASPAEADLAAPASASVPAPESGRARTSRRRSRR